MCKKFKFSLKILHRNHFHNQSYLKIENKKFPIIGIQCDLVLNAIQTIKLFWLQLRITSVRCHYDIILIYCWLGYDGDSAVWHGTYFSYNLLLN